MKIAFDYQIFTLQAYGGISRYFSRLAENLVVLGNEVKIISGMHRNNYIDDLPVEMVIGSRLPAMFRTSKASRFFMMVNRGIYNQGISKFRPEIIHETYYSSSQPGAGNAATVITVHDLIHELYPKKHGDGGKTAYFKKKAIQRADHIICVSQNTKKDLVDLYDVDEKKLTVILHGVDFSTFNENKKFVEKRGKPYLLFVGSRYGYKNFNGLLSAYAGSSRLSKDFDLYVFGGKPIGSSEYSFMRSIGIDAEKIRYWNGDDALLSDLYSGATALIYPSMYEGFGMPLLEAMACGCPVACSNVSSLPEVGGESVEYFNPEDTGSMINAIESVAYSSSRSSELITAGLVHVKKFNWPETARKTLEVYKKLV